jgi:hypothetical protein
MAAYTSTQSGPASLASTWGGSGPPADGDTITVASGHTVTQDVNRTYGATIGTPGHAVTINGTNSTTYGKLVVPSGVTLTLRGLDLTTNTLGLVNQYGWLDVQSGATVLGDPSGDYTSAVINKGRITASGATFSAPAGNCPWNNAVSGESLTNSIGGLYDLPNNVYAFVLANPWVADNGGTGLGTVNPTTPAITFTAQTAGTLATEVALPAFSYSGGQFLNDIASAVNGAGKYAVDYETGVVYFYTVAASPVATATYKCLTFAKSWGIQTTQSGTAGQGNSATFAGCTFNYMGRYQSGTNAHFAVMASNRNSAAANAAANPGDFSTSARLFSFTGNTVRYCGHFLLLTNCTGTAADPVLVTGNTFGHCRYTGDTPVSSGQIPTYGAAVGAYLTTNGYVSLSNNALNLRGPFFTAKASTPTRQDHTGMRFDGNTGRTPTLIHAAFPQNAFPGGTASNNHLSGLGVAYDTRFINGVAGSASAAGSRFTVSGNDLQRMKRFVHSTSYLTNSGNTYRHAYHHFCPADITDNIYLFDVVITDNLAINNVPSATCPSPAFEIGYNHRMQCDQFVIANNTTVNHPLGAVGIGDCQDNSGVAVLVTNALAVNNLAYNSAAGGASGGLALAKRPADTSSWLTKAHLLRLDNGDACNTTYSYTLGSNSPAATGPGAAFNAGGTFTLGGQPYNALSGASRNLPGLALASPSASLPTSNLQVVYAVTTPGVTETLKLSSNGGSTYGTARSIVFGNGTTTAAAAGALIAGAFPAGVTLTDSAANGGSLWSTSFNASTCPLLRWYKVTSGRLSGQVRAVLQVNTTSSLTVVPPFVAASGSGGSGNVTGATNPSGTPIVITTGQGVNNATNANVTATVATVPTSTTFTMTGVNGTGGSAGTIGFYFAVPATGDSYTIYESEVGLSDAAANTLQAGLCGYTQGSYPVFPFGTAGSDTGISRATGDITGDPLLSNASGSTAADFKLTASSPAKAAGVTIAAVTPTTDYFGTSYGSPPSIGFAEIVAAGGVPLVGNGLLSSPLIR